MTDAPTVSVIIPVRNRRDLLRDTLEALARQTVLDHEVIVIDDGSTDGSGELARTFVEGGRVRVLNGGGRGAVAARCLGVNEASAPVLAFTDSDCQPAPDWLERGLARIDAGADAVQGRTEPRGPVGPLERTVWVTRSDGLYATCNMLYRRDAFEAAGGFDTAAERRLGFRPGRLRGLGFGEDTLLGWRVRQRGAAVFAPEVLVYHHVFPPDHREHLARSWHAGGFTGLVREVPELRTELLRHRFLLGSGTRVPLYLAAGLAVTGRRRSAGVALSAWVGVHARLLRRSSGGRRRQLAALPVVLLGDAVTAASLVAGSIRARAVVL